MVTVKQFCCCLSLKTGAYVAVVLFMIRCLLLIVFNGILVGDSGRYLDMAHYSYNLLIWAALLIFCINVIMGIRKENLKTILAFLLVLAYFMVENSKYMLYKVVYFFWGYNYDIYDNFLLRPAIIIVYAYAVVVVFSFYRQLKTAQKMARTNEIHHQNEKKQIPV